MLLQTPTVENETFSHIFYSYLTEKKEKAAGEKS